MSPSFLAAPEMCWLRSATSGSEQRKCQLGDHNNHYLESDPWGTSVPVGQPCVALSPRHAVLSPRSEPSRQDDLNRWDRRPESAQSGTAADGPNLSPHLLDRWEPCYRFLRFAVLAGHAARGP